VWLIVLVVLAIGAAAAAFVLRPNDTPTKVASGTATPQVSGTPSGPQKVLTPAYTLELPAGWEQKCSDQPVCAGVQLPNGWTRSAFAKGSGNTAAGITVDRYALAGGLSLRQLADSNEQGLTKLKRYVRTGGGKVRAVTLGAGRPALQYSFATEDAQRHYGTVFVFKDGHVAYVIIGTSASDPTAAENDAYAIAQSLDPRG
jgi:hypothetical protein